VSAIDWNVRKRGQQWRQCTDVIKVGVCENHSVQPRNAFNIRQTEPAVAGGVKPGIDQEPPVAERVVIRVGTDLPGAANGFKRNRD
jgi:hypothetical protein